MQAGDEVPTYPHLAGKVSVVTGGSGGIGAATCRLFAANGPRSRSTALAAVFLASDSAAWLTGVTLDVAGGYVMT